MQASKRSSESTSALFRQGIDCCLSDWNAVKISNAVSRQITKRVPRLHQ
jgi:hypothetical protein